MLGRKESLHSGEHRNFKLSANALLAPKEADVASDFLVHLLGSRLLVNRRTHLHSPPAPPRTTALLVFIVVSGAAGGWLRR